MRLRRGRIFADHTYFIKLDNKWVSPSAVVSDWEEDTGIKALIEPSKIKKWVNDRIRKLITYEQYIPSLALIDIKDHIGTVPEDFHLIIQAAYGFVENKGCTREQVVQWTGRDLNGCKLKIELECPKCHKSDCDCSVPYARFDVNALDINAHPEWEERWRTSFYSYGKIGQNTCSGFNPNFFLMKPTTNHYFNAKHHIKKCLNLKTDSRVEYQLNLPEMEVNIDTCKVLLAYMAHRMDEKGFLMIPDIPEVWDTLKYHIDSKLAYIRWTRERKPEDERFYMRLSQLDKDSGLEAKIRLNRPDLQKFKSIWHNFYGKIIPHYYYEETYGAEVNDTYKEY